MPVELKFGPADNILIFELKEAFIADEFRDALDSELFIRVYDQPETSFIVIYDTRETQFDFAEFNKYLRHSATRRETMPENYDSQVTQIIVGNDDWIRSIRNWFDKRFDVGFPLFDNLQEAIEFGQNQLNK